MLKQSGHLSVHQLAAYFSILQVHKCKIAKQPHYLYDRLYPGGNAIKNDLGNLRSETNEHISIDYDKSLTRASFFYKASKLYNALPVTLKETTITSSFKCNVKAWIKLNVAAIP